jgi:aspartate kinase
MRVLKFGGTSVKDAVAINKVLDIISKDKDSKIVVVSAFSKVTDGLLSLCASIGTNEFEPKLNELIQKHKQVAIDLIDNVERLNEVIKFIENEFAKLLLQANAVTTNKTKDLFASYGEMMSSYIINEAAKERGIKSINLNSIELIKTDSNFVEANIDSLSSYSLISNKYNELKDSVDLFIAGGFIASNYQGEPTTLGRGGSDFSGAIYAAALNAEILEIWTDVDGILTCDPRLINDVKRIKSLSYKEAGELAYFGAKVLHPKTILPAIEKKIPVVVKNTFNPENSGTYILDESENIKTIKAIAFKKGITIINITSNRMLGAYGFLAKVFDVFRDNKTSVDIITTSEVSVSLTIDDNINLANIVEELGRFANVELNHGNSVISVVGEGIRLTAGIAARFFGVLKGINILMVSFGASEVNLTIMVKDEDVEKSVKLLHEEFFSNNLDKEVFI